MMWDFAAGNNNEQRNGYDGQHSTPPFGMPSPSFPGASPPSVAYTDASTYSSSLSHPSSYSDFQSSPSFLAVPGGPEASRSASAQGYQSHHSHSHSHHHQHHRHHSNPGSSPLLLFPPSPAPPPPHHRLTRPVSAYDIPSSSYSAYDLHQQRPPPQQRPPQQRPPTQQLPPPQQSQRPHQQLQRPPQQQHQPQQVYSTCTGRKKALCIGINYIGHPQALRGCINDARHVHDFLIKRWGYKHEDIVMLTDDSKNPRQRPTRANIIDAMRWLVKDAKTNDSLFFHYSGHGGQTRDLDGDEIDGYDEVIYPMDFERSGHLTDDVMHKILVKSLPRGCRLTALFDCCHSGTVLDMPYIYRSDGKLKGLQIKERTRMQKATNADVITWSGSKDGQTSADTFAGGVAVGAMSYAFITALTAKPNQTYQELLKSVRKILYDKYSQKPQLSSSHHIDTNMRFVM